MGANQFWILNGKDVRYSYNLTGIQGEKLNKKYNTDYFKNVTILYVDIYYNHNEEEGLMKMRRLGYQDENADDYEIKISGINKSIENKEKEWIPHFVFDDMRDNKQRISFASIPSSWYGIMHDIDWN